MGLNGANGCGRSAARESKGAGCCGLARAACQRGPTTDQLKSKTQNVLGYLKKQLKRKKKNW